MIDLPKEVTINFNSFDDDIINKQINQINQELLTFKVNLITSKEVQNKNYVSFSQMINDAIIRAKDEFIIFINPKVNIKTNDLQDIIEKLCDGFCFVSKIGFAFFGITKELVRNIGLLDENFIGGEYEDDDFYIRLKIFGKKIFWGHNFENYDLYHSYYNLNRGSSHSYFVKKWCYSNNKIFFTQDMNEKKIVDNNNNEYIKKSWGNFKDSYFEGHVASKYNEVEIKEITNKITTIKSTKFILTFDLNQNNFYVELNSDDSFMGISVILTRVHENGRTPILGTFLYNKMWYRYDLDIDDIFFEMRLFLDGNPIYVNTIKRGSLENIYFELPATNFL